MKKLFGLVLLMCLPFLASSTTFKEGVHYTQINDSVTTKPEVREYFSFYCPHCKSFEPFMADVKKGLPSNVSFERNHVDFLRAASPKVQQMLSKATVVATQLGMEAKLVGALFNYIQVQRAVVTSERDIRNVFVLNGADGEKFDKLMKSFSVNSKAKVMKKNQDTLTKKRAITGVPAVIVNGKYRIDPKGLDNKNFNNEYKALVAHLLTLK